MAYALSDQFYGVYDNTRTAGLTKQHKPDHSPLVKEGLAFHELVQNQFRSPPPAISPPSSLTKGGAELTASQKTSPPPSQTSFANPALTATTAQTATDQSWSFLDFIDIINPLQHIPIVSQIYRAVTGDEIKAASNIAGGVLFGGAIGGALAMADVAFKDATGKDMGETMLSAITAPQKETTQYAQNTLPENTLSPALSTKLSLAADGSAPTKPKPIAADNLLTKDTSIAHRKTMTEKADAMAIASASLHSFSFDHADLAMKDSLSPDRISFYPPAEDDQPLPASHLLYGQKTYQEITLKNPRQNL